MDSLPELALQEMAVAHLHGHKIAALDAVAFCEHCGIVAHPLWASRYFVEAALHPETKNGVKADHGEKKYEKYLKDAVRYLAVFAAQEHLRINGRTKYDIRFDIASNLLRDKHPWAVTPTELKNDSGDSHYKWLKRSHTKYPTYPGPFYLSYTFYVGNPQYADIYWLFHGCFPSFVLPSRTTT